MQEPRLAAVRTEIKFGSGGFGARPPCAAAYRARPQYSAAATTAGTSTADALAAKLGNELLALADRQGGIIGGAVRSGRNAKQVVATFVPHYREALPFAWSTVQEANDEAIKSWFHYYELNMQRDKGQPRNYGDDATVFFNGKDMRYGDVLDTFISEAQQGRLHI